MKRIFENSIQYCIKLYAILDEDKSDVKSKLYCCSNYTASGKDITVLVSTSQ
jgi:hypothetical protein